MADMKENIHVDQGMEDDELAGLPVTKRPRVTPRNSTAAQVTPQPTPHANLRALAGLIRRPSTPAPRRASNVGTAFSAGKVTSTTPMLQPSNTSRTRRPLQSVGPNGSNPTTPHTIRALKQRRATPAQERRKSGRAQRETPRDALRNLSEILAKTSQPIRPSPLSAPPAATLFKQQETDEFEDELSPEPPGFSIAVDNDEDDESSLMNRPRFSIPFEEGEQTAKSIEISRRALTGDDRERLSRGSFGSIRDSDKFARQGMLGMDDSRDGVEDGSEDHQWQDVNEDIGDFTRGSESGGDLRHIVRGTSEENDELSGDHLEASAHTAAYSPFVLNIPDMQPRDPSMQSPAYDNLPNDDILQFGTPLLRSEPPIPRPFHPAAMQRPVPKATLKAKPRAKVRKVLKVSRHGISYSGLPIGITKSIATTFARSMAKKTARLGKDTMETVLKAGERFFEQLGGDLEEMSKHAGRKTIDESDVIAIMQRQRQISVRATAFSLASRYLPGETLKEMRMPVRKMERQRRRLPLEDIAEDAREDDE